MGTALCCSALYTKANGDPSPWLTSHSGSS